MKEHLLWSVAAAELPSLLESNMRATLFRDRPTTRTRRFLIVHSKRIWVGPDQPTRQMVVMRLTNIVFFTMLYIYSDNKPKFLQAHFFHYYYYYNYNNYTLTAVSTLNHWLNPNAPSILIYDALMHWQREIFFLLTGFWFDFVPSHARFRFKKDWKLLSTIWTKANKYATDRYVRHYRLLSSH